MVWLATDREQIDCLRPAAMGVFNPAELAVSVLGRQYLSSIPPNMHVESHVNTFVLVTQTTLKKPPKETRTTMTIQHCELLVFASSAELFTSGGRANGGRQAAGAGDICDPAQQWWMPDTCFSLNGSWHHFCLAGLMPTCAATDTHTFEMQQL